MAVCFVFFHSTCMAIKSGLLQDAMYNSAMEAVQQLRDPAGGPLLEQLRSARPDIHSLEHLRWGFYGHLLGGDVVFPLADKFMREWDDVAGGVASVNPTGALATMSLADCLQHSGEVLLWSCCSQAGLLSPGTFVSACMAVPTLLYGVP